MRDTLFPATRWRRHRKTGNTYRVLGEGELQCSSKPHIQEGERLTVYMGGDGRIWLRPVAEFSERFDSVGDD